MRTLCEDRGTLAQAGEHQCDCRSVMRLVGQAATRSHSDLDVRVLAAHPNRTLTWQ